MRAWCPPPQRLAMWDWCSAYHLVCIGLLPTAGLLRVEIAPAGARHATLPAPLAPTRTSPVGQSRSAAARIREQRLDGNDSSCHGSGKSELCSTGADHYFQFGFTIAAGNLAAGATADVGPGFNKNDFSSFDQTNDYSVQQLDRLLDGYDRHYVFERHARLRNRADVSAQSGSGIPSTMRSTSPRRSTEANPALAARAAASTSCLAGQHPKLSPYSTGRTSVHLTGPWQVRQGGRVLPASMRMGGMGCFDPLVQTPM